jgi:hypothetical protein
MSACDSFRFSSVPTGTVRFIGADPSLPHLPLSSEPGAATAIPHEQAAPSQPLGGPRRSLRSLRCLWIDVRECNQETLERISPTPDLVRARSGTRVARKHTSPEGEGALEQRRGTMGISGPNRTRSWPPPPHPSTSTHELLRTRRSRGRFSRLRRGDSHLSPRTDC